MYKNRFGKSLKGERTSFGTTVADLKGLLASLGSQGMMLNNVTITTAMIYGGTIDDMEIGAIQPSSGIFTRLAVGNDSGTGGPFVAYGNTVGDYVKWDPVTSRLEIAGGMSVRDAVATGNILIRGNDISAINTDGSINLVPNSSKAAVYVAGSLQQSAPGIVGFEKATNFTVESDKDIGLTADKAVKVTARDGPISITAPNGPVELLSDKEVSFRVDVPLVFSREKATNEPRGYQPPKLMATSGDKMLFTASDFIFDDPILTLRSRRNHFCDSGILAEYSEDGKTKRGFFGFIDNTKSLTWIPSATVSVDALTGEKNILGERGVVHLDGIIVSKLVGDPDLILDAPRGRIAMNTNKPIELPSNGSLAFGVSPQLPRGEAGISHDAIGQDLFVSARRDVILDAHRHVVIPDGVPLVFSDSELGAQKIMKTPEGLVFQSQPPLPIIFKGDVVLPNPYSFKIGETILSSGDGKGLSVSSPGDIRATAAGDMALIAANGNATVGSTSGNVSILAENRIKIPDNVLLQIGDTAATGLIGTSGKLTVTSRDDLALKPDSGVIKAEAVSFRLPDRSEVSFGSTAAVSTLGDMGDLLLQSDRGSTTLLAKVGTTNVIGVAGVNMKSAVGDINIDALKGRLSVQGTSSLDLLSSQGHVSLIGETGIAAKAMHGDARLIAMEGQTEVTGTLGVKLEAAQGDISILAHGTNRIASGTGLVSIDGNAGVRLQSQEADVSIETTLGDISLNTLQGQIELRGHDGVQVSATQGNIDLTAGDGAYTVNATRGVSMITHEAVDIEGKDVSMTGETLALSGDNVRVSASNEVKVESTGGPVTLQGSTGVGLVAVSGTLAVEAQTGPLEITSASTVRIEGAIATQLSSALGEVEISAATTATIQSGRDIVLQAEQGTQVEGRTGLTLSSSAGDVMIEAKAAGTQVRIEGAAVEVSAGSFTAITQDDMSLKSVAGDINLMATSGGLTAAVSDRIELKAQNGAAMIAEQGNAQLIANGETGDVVLSGQGISLKATEAVTVPVGVPLGFGGNSRIYESPADGRLHISDPEGVVIDRNLVINGDFTVVGESSKIVATVTTFHDGIISLATDAPAIDRTDRGVEFLWHDLVGLPKWGFMGFSQQEQRFKLITDGTNNREVYDVTRWGDLELGNLIAFESVTSSRVVAQFMASSPGSDLTLEGKNIRLTPSEAVSIPSNIPVSIGASLLQDNASTGLAIDTNLLTLVQGALSIGSTSVSTNASNSDFTISPSQLGKIVLDAPTFIPRELNLGLPGDAKASFSLVNGTDLQVSAGASLKIAAKSTAELSSETMVSITSDDLVSLSSSTISMRAVVEASIISEKALSLSSEQSLTLTSQEDVQVLSQRDVQVTASRDINLEATGGLALSSHDSPLNVQSDSGINLASAGSISAASSDRLMLAGTLGVDVESDHAIRMDSKGAIQLAAITDVGVSSQGTVSIDAEQKVSIASKSSVSVQAGTAFDVQSTGVMSLHSTSSVLLHGAETLSLSAVGSATLTGNDVSLSAAESVSVSSASIVSVRGDEEVAISSKQGVAVGSNRFTVLAEERVSITSGEEGSTIASQGAIDVKATDQLRFSTSSDLSLVSGANLVGRSAAGIDLSAEGQAVFASTGPLQVGSSSSTTLISSGKDLVVRADDDLRLSSATGKISLASETLVETKLSFADITLSSPSSSLLEIRNNADPLKDVSVDIQGSITGDCTWLGNPIPAAQGGTGHLGAWLPRSIVYVSAEGKLSDSPDELCWDHFMQSMGIRSAITYADAAITIGTGHVDLRGDNAAVRYYSEGKLSWCAGTESVDAESLFVVSSFDVDRAVPLFLGNRIGQMGIGFTAEEMRGLQQLGGSRDTLGVLGLNGSLFFASSLSINSAPNNADPVHRIHWAAGLSIAGEPHTGSLILESPSRTIVTSRLVCPRGVQFDMEQVPTLTIDGNVTSRSITVAAPSSIRLTSPHVIHSERICFSHGIDDTCTTYFHRVGPDLAFVNDIGDILLAPLLSVTLAEGAQLNLTNVGSIGPTMNGAVGAEGKPLMHINSVHGTVIQGGAAKVITIPSSDRLVFSADNAGTELRPSASIGLDTAGVFTVATAPSVGIHLSTDHSVRIPDNVPLVFGNDSSQRRIESDGDSLLIHSNDLITLSSNNVVVTGNFVVKKSSTFTVESETGFDSGVINLGGGQVHNIVNAVAGPGHDQTTLTLDIPHALIPGDSIDVNDTIPNVDGDYLVSAVPSLRTLVIDKPFPGLPTGAMVQGTVRSKLTNNTNTDVGVVVNWHLGTQEGTSDARTGFFGFDRSTGRFTFIPEATRTAGDIFTGTPGDFQVGSVFSSNIQASGSIVVAGDLSAKGLSAERLLSPLETGLQKVSGQNFVIKGGSIDATPIGLGTPDQGKFTYLEVTEGLFVKNGNIVSNLNADLLDGKHASDFILRDGSTPLTSDWNIGPFKLSAGELAILGLPATAVPFVGQDGTLIANVNSLAFVDGVLRVSQLSGFTAHGDIDMDHHNIKNTTVTNSTVTEATIHHSDITLDGGNTFDASAGTVKFADDQISGDAISGGTANIDITGTADLVRDGIYRRDFAADHTLIKADEAGTPTAMVVPPGTLIGRSPEDSSSIRPLTVAETMSMLNAVDRDVFAQDHTIVKADEAGQPISMEVPENTLVGRTPGGTIRPLVAQEVRDMLNVEPTTTAVIYREGALLRSGHREFPGGGTMTGLLFTSSERFHVATGQTPRILDLNVESSYILCDYLRTGGSVAHCTLGQGFADGHRKLIILSKLAEFAVVQVSCNLVAPKTPDPCGIVFHITGQTAVLQWDSYLSRWFIVGGSGAEVVTPDDLAQPNFVTELLERDDEDENLAVVDTTNRLETLTQELEALRAHVRGRR